MSEQSDNHDEILKELKEIKTTLKPIAESYNAVIRLGTWAKWGLGFLLLCMSLYLAIKQAIKG